MSYSSGYSQSHVHCSSASASGQSVNTELERHAPPCYCGLKAPLRTVTSTENVERRFYGCANWPNSCCTSYIWIDKKQLCKRGKEYAFELLAEISTLRRKVRNLENVAEHLGKQEGPAEVAEVAEVAKK